MKTVLWAKVSWNHDPEWWFGYWHDGLFTPIQRMVNS